MFETLVEKLLNRGISLVAKILVPNLWGHKSTFIKIRPLNFHLLISYVLERVGLFRFTFIPCLGGILGVPTPRGLANLNSACVLWICLYNLRKNDTSVFFDVHVHKRVGHTCIQPFSNT